MKTIDLKSFISSSLQQIMEGCRQAQDNLHDRSHARICPRVDQTFSEGAQGVKDVIGQTETFRLVHAIDFDVAVTVTDEKDEKYGIGVIAAFVSAGAGEQVSQTNSAVSRIKFSIPVCYPEVAGN